MGKNVFDLSGKTAIITGAGGGLGRSMAVGFAQYRANVVCADVNNEGIKETAEFVKKEGRESLGPM